MNVGIYTRYEYRDITYAAVHLADLFERWNCSVSFLSPTPGPVHIYDHWDREVIRSHELNFTDWARGRDVIIWTSCPHPGQVEWAGKHGIRTILLSTGDDHATTIQELYPVFDKVILASRAWARVVGTHYHANNTITIPWSPCLPASIKGVRDPTAPVRLHLPLYGCHGRNITVEALSIVRDLLTIGGQSLAIDIAYANWTPPALRWLAKLDREFKEDWRLTTGRVENYDKQLLNFGRQDLALLLSPRDTMGMQGLCAMHMGVPAVGFDIPPLNEFVKDGRNGILVPCEHGKDEFGTTVAFSPNYATYAERIIDAVSSPTLLAKVQFNCRSGLDKRRRDFETAWAKLIRAAA